MKYCQITKNQIQNWKMPKSSQVEVWKLWKIFRILVNVKLDSVMQLQIQAIS